MSTKIAYKVLKGFLTDKANDVLSLKGNWGTGKTYTWSEIVIKASSEKALGKPKYSYVSLFGIETLDALKTSIFENTIDPDLIIEGPSLKTLSSNIANIFREHTENNDEPKTTFGFWRKSKSARSGATWQARKALPHIQSLPLVKDFVPFLRSASFLSVKDTIICIDDFERKGDSLKAKDVFGLITILKEQKNCKVALILNDNSLNGDEAKAYSTYREKVIDIELAFNPTTQECADLVFTEDNEACKFARENVINLGIKNIRIIQRIKRLIDNVINEVASYDIEVRKHVNHSLCLMGWSFFSGEGDAPPLSHIDNLSYEFTGLLPEDKKISDEEKSWNAQLRSYNYTSTDEIDIVLLDYVTKGYYDNEALHEKLNNEHQSIIATRSGNSFHNAWGLYHNSFNDNSDELVQILIDRLTENAKYLSPRDLNGTVTLFRELAKSEAADQIIDVYIKANENRPNLFSLDNHYVLSSITDRKIREIFKEKGYKTEKTLSLEDVISKIWRSDSWGNRDEDFLSKTSVDGYYAFFNKTNSEDLSAYIDCLLKFGKVKNASEPQKVIAENTKLALIRIAQENKLNELRVKKFGIEIKKEMKP